MSLIKKVSEIIKEPVNGFKPATKGWFTVVRAGDPASLRFHILVKKDEFNYVMLLHDFKDEDKTTPYPLSSFDKEYEELHTTAETSDKPRKIGYDIHSYYERLEPATESLYLKNKNIPFPKDLKGVRVSKQGETAVPYSELETPDIICGLKFYSPVKKMCLSGSKMKGACFQARKSLDRSRVYLVEGFADAVAVMLSTKDSTVIECGGLGNVRPILNFTTKIYTKVVVVGENDSISKYQSLGLGHKNVEIVFPEKGKDIADLYCLEGEKAVRKTLFNVGGGAYKALGFIGKNLVIYSKTLKSVEEFNLTSIVELLTLGIGIPDAGGLDRESAQRLVAKVVGECADIGQYSTNNEKGVGLYKYKNEHFYNAGRTIYQLGDDILINRSFSDVVRDDFLVVSRKTELKELKDQKYDFDSLLKCFYSCDWEKSWYADIFFGFLVQSVYAGVSDFSPHLWVESNKPKSGKSWLTEWVVQNLMPDAPTHDGAGSTFKGFRQSLRFWRGLAVIDEFAESDSLEKKNIVGIIQTMRSGATGNVPITLGTKRQIPISVWVKFSALLSCISGQENLKPQDYERIIFLNMCRNENTLFVENGFHLFEEHKKNNCPEGFLHEVLLKFHVYRRNYHGLLVDIQKKRPSLGHKARGLASILAGHLAIFNDRTRINKLIEHCLADKVTAPLKESDYTKDLYSDIMDVIIPKSISSWMNDAPISKLLAEDYLKDYGCFSTKDGGFVIDAKKINPLLKKYFRDINEGLLVKKLKDSVYYLGPYYTKDGDRKTVRLLKFKEVE